MSAFRRSDMMARGRRCTRGTTQRSFAWPRRDGSVPWVPPAVDVDLIDLTDRKGAWALEEMERGMAEHWMGYRRTMNRRKLAGSGLA